MHCVKRPRMAWPSDWRCAREEARPENTAPEHDGKNGDQPLDIRSYTCILVCYETAGLSDTAGQANRGVPAETPCVCCTPCIALWSWRLPGRMPRWGIARGRRSPARGPGARRGTRKVMRHCIPCIALRARRSRSGSLRSAHTGLRKIDPGSWIRVGRKCASFLPSHTVRSWAEGLWFPQHRASPSLYYTSRVRPRPACPAGERGWKATTETECSSRPRPARPDGE